MNLSGADHRSNETTAKKTKQKKMASARKSKYHVRLYTLFHLRPNTNNHTALRDIEICLMLCFLRSPYDTLDIGMFRCMTSALLPIVAKSATCGAFRFTSNKGGRLTSEIAEAISGGQALPDPLLYHVPTVCTRPVGRDNTVMKLWQSALQGHRVHVITAADGIGKSTVAVEFCECARRSKRFSCIHWIASDGCDTPTLKENIATFFNAMRGRMEKDVLLVLDDVLDPVTIAAIIPKHSSLFVLMTSAKHTLAASKDYHVVPVETLTEEAVKAFYNPLDDDAETRMTLYATVGFVPLLTSVARALLNAGAATSDDLVKTLTATAERNGGISIRGTLAALIDIAKTHIEAEFGQSALNVLHCLSCFHTESISPNIFDSTVTLFRGKEADSEKLISAFRALSLFSEKWEGEGITCHSVTATVLRSSCDQTQLENAAAILHGLFPRRWRGMSSDAAMDLVRHTQVMAKLFADRKVALTPSLMSCCDRAAAICAYHEGRELHTAVALWGSLLTQMKEQSNGAVTSEMCRISSESGKVLHHLRHANAKAALEEAYAFACELHGTLSPEAAVPLSVLCLYMDDTMKTCELLRNAEGAIRGRLCSTDDVVPAEEARMLRETIAVLLTRRVQIAEVLNDHTDPNTLGAWEALQDHKADMKRFDEAATSTTRQRQR